MTHYQVEIQIQDFGKGMDAETKDNIFQPYFTTKPTGTGLGMAIVQKIVEDHFGEIKINSEKGAGTTVTLLFPRSIIS